MIERLTESSSETETLAAAVARSLEAGDVLALSGPLGSGKTTFVRGLARGLGINPARVSSPTFVICHEYEGEGRLRLIHIDAYRLGSESELETLGWDELLQLDDAVITVEWPERIDAALPDEYIRVTFESVGPYERRLLFEGPPRVLAMLDNTSAKPNADRPCPKCGEQVSRESAHFPFCSNRCRMADLGQWFSESYRMTRPAFTEEDDEELL